MYHSHLIGVMQIMNISDKNLDPICFVEISIWWDNGRFYSVESTLDTVQNMQVA